jgi:hypothetical protein
MKNLSDNSNNTKNSNSLQVEVLDRLLNANLIDEQQLQAGVTFRVLRYKKFGKSSCTAKNYDTILSNYNAANDNNEFEQKIFTESLKILREINADSAVLDACIYNISPKNVLILNKVKDGLKTLTEFYNKSFFTVR